MDGTSLGNRMKRYEEVSCVSLTPRMPMIIRVDGRAFHTYTRRLKRTEGSPWSTHIRSGMTAVARALLREVSGAKIAYLQSDEVSVLVTDYGRNNTQPWFDKIAQKITSISAALATAEFNQTMLALEMSHQTVEVDKEGQHSFVLKFPRLATFDSRCFVLPREDVCNYFVWRQRDAEKNSVSMLAQSHFSHKQLHGKNGGAMQDMLMLERGVNWNDCEVWQKRGWCVVRRTVTMTLAEHQAREGRVRLPKDVQVDPDRQVCRTAIEPDWDIPVFTKDRDYIEQHLRPEDEDALNAAVGART